MICTSTVTTVYLDFVPILIELTEHCTVTWNVSVLCITYRKHVTLLRSNPKCGYVLQERRVVRIFRWKIISAENLRQKHVRLSRKPNKTLRLRSPEVRLEVECLVILAINPTAPVPHTATRAHRRAVRYHNYITSLMLTQMLPIRAEPNRPLWNGFSSSLWLCEAKRQNKFSGVKTGDPHVVKCRTFSYRCFEMRTPTLNSSDSGRWLWAADISEHVSSKKFTRYAYCT